jgi:hypothetical protein
MWGGCHALGEGGDEVARSAGRRRTEGDKEGWQSEKGEREREREREREDWQREREEMRRLVHRLQEEVQVIYMAHSLLLFLHACVRVSVFVCMCVVCVCVCVCARARACASSREEQGLAKGVSVC